MPFETECSDVCDAVVYPLKELGIDVYKDGSDYDLDHDKVVKALQDEVVLIKRVTGFTREGLLSTKKDPKEVMTSEQELIDLFLIATRLCKGAGIEKSALKDWVDARYRVN